MYFARKININSTFKYILNYTNYKYIKIIYSTLKSKVKFRPMIIYLLLNNNNNYDLFIYFANNINKNIVSINENIIY